MEPTAAVDGIAAGAGEVVAVHAVVVLEVVDDRLDGGPAPHLAFDGFGHATFLTGSVDLETVGLERIVALVAGVGDDAARTW